MYLTINEEQLGRTAKRGKERNIIIPTFSQLKNPNMTTSRIKESLKQTHARDVAPHNLFRITWKNEPTPPMGGLFRPLANYIELPPELTGVETRIARAPSSPHNAFGISTREYS